MAAIGAKTLVVRVEVPDADSAVLRNAAASSAWWMEAVFRRLYTDRRQGWGTYGPAVDWGKKYGALVRPLPSGRWEVRHEAMYAAFVRLGRSDSPPAPDRLPSSLRCTTLQALAEKVATAWGNFLNADTPRPRLGIPRFRPVVRFRAQTVRFEERDGRLLLRVPSAQRGGRSVTLRVATSSDPGWHRRLAPLRRYLGRRNTPSVEVHEDDRDGKWYAHIPIPFEVPERAPGRVLGIRLSTGNVFHAAVGNAVRSLPRGRLVHRLDRAHARIRGLRSKADRGGRAARKTLRRLRGKRRRMQEAFFRQGIPRLLDGGLHEGAGTVAVENLRHLRPKSRLVSEWARGRTRDYLGFKARERGLRLVEVSSAGLRKQFPTDAQAAREIARRGALHLPSGSSPEPRPTGGTGPPGPGEARYPPALRRPGPGRGAARTGPDEPGHSAPPRKGARHVPGRAGENGNRRKGRVRRGSRERRGGDGPPGDRSRPEGEGG